MTPETRLKNEILLECGRRGWIAFHMNVGTYQLITGQFISTGIPKGFPDLMVLTDTGRALFIETKIHPRKPTKEQLRWIEDLSARGFVSFVCYFFNDFLSHIKNIEKL